MLSKAVQSLLFLAMFASVFALIYTQGNRSIYARSSGLFALLAVGFLAQFSSNNPNYVSLAFLVLLCGLGFASDYFSATLRTWYFRVSEKALFGLFWGTFIGIFAMAFFRNSMLAFLFCGFLGALIGEFRAMRRKDLKRLLKSSVGAITGVFGMALKLVLGLEMVALIWSAVLLQSH